MYIEFFTVNGHEYARTRRSVREGSAVKHDKGVSLGRVLDKKRLIFQNRSKGVFQYDRNTGEFLPPPEDFGLKVVRRNARESLIVDFGNAYFIDKYIERVGLRSVFNAVGYGNMDSFYALLFYYLLESRSNAHAQDWYEGSYARILFPKALLSSPRISDMLGGIGDETVWRRFFSAYVSYLGKDTVEATKEGILIDSTGLPNNIRMPVTAISSHNGEINNEVRLIYVVQRGTGMPIYMRCIPGNVVDVSTLLTTIAELKAMKVDTKFAILDAGYLSLETMGELLDRKISFLARVKKNWTFYKQIVAEHLPELECRRYRQLHNGRFVYLKCVEYRYSGEHTLYCYLGIDEDRRSNERRILAQKIEEDELSPDEVDRRMRTQGVFMLVCSRRVAVKDLLPLYYTRQDIEQVFDISKGYAKALPLCVQTAGTFRGHLLMVFCSTILLRKLQQQLLSTKYSLDDFQYIMRNQKAKVFDDVVIPSETTKKQNELYSLIKMRPDVAIHRPTQPQTTQEAV